MTLTLTEIALHLAGGAGVFAAALFLCLPMLAKPLSEDEGNWFYPAVFHDKGERIHGAYSAFGYFNLPLAAVLAARLLRRSDPRFLQWFKVAWYAVTAASVYALSLALFGSGWAALAAGLFYAVAMGTGSTLFALSYAEHYSLLWMNLAALCVLPGLGGGPLALCALAGLLAGLAVQFKPTGLVFAGALPLAYLGRPDPVAALAAYGAALVALQLLPLALLRLQGLRTEAYVRDTLRAPLEDGLVALSRLLRLHGLERRLGVGMSEYVDNRHESSRNNDWAQFKANMRPCISDLRLILVLALGRAAYGAAGLSFAELFLTVLVGLHILAQQAQKNYYTPHFNPIWVPLCVLAGAALPGCLALVATGGPGGWAFGAVLAWEGARLAAALRREWLSGAELRFGFLHPIAGMIFALARTAGEAIRDMSRENDRLCVWGDQPSVYLYARRRSFRAKEMFFYGHHMRLTREIWIIEALREHPPEYILFFNWRVADDWTMERVTGRTGHYYTQVGHFDLRGEDDAVVPGLHGRPCSFPLYRRDDVRYEQAMLERAETSADTATAEAVLRELLEKVPDSFEGVLRLGVLRRGEGVRALRKEAAGLLASETDPARVASLRLVLAGVFLELGDAALAERELEKIAPEAACRARALVLLGAARSALGRKAAAMQAYRQSHELHPYGPGALCGMGECLLAAGNTAEALRMFERALSFVPSHAAAAAHMDAIHGGPDERLKYFWRLGVRREWRSEKNIAQICGRKP